MREAQKGSLGDPTLLLRAMQIYHRYEARGIDNIPKSGRALVVVNHSFATYDIVMLFHAIQKAAGRMARPLADRFFFKTPGMSGLATTYGGVEGTNKNAEELLDRDELVLVAPGGMKEMVRSSKEKYKLTWGNRKGFARLAILKQTPIILAVCPKADDLFHVYDSPLTPLAYRFLHFPVVALRGVGPTLVPRPVKLIHYVDRPIMPPKGLKNEAGLNEQVEEFHAKIYRRASRLMDQGACS